MVWFNNTVYPVFLGFKAIMILSLYRRLRPWIAVAYSAPVVAATAVSFVGAVPTWACSRVLGRYRCGLVTSPNLAGPRIYLRWLRRCDSEMASNCVGQRWVLLLQPSDVALRTDNLQSEDHHLDLVLIHSSAASTGSRIEVEAIKLIAYTEHVTCRRLWLWRRLWNLVPYK